MPRGKPTPYCAECGQPRPLKHIGPPSSRGSAPLDTGVVAELRAKCAATSQAEVSRLCGVSTSAISRALRGVRISKALRDTLNAHTRQSETEKT